MNKIAPYAKAIVAALVAGLGSLYQALDGDQNVSSQEWVAVAMTTLAGLAVVFAVPNKDPEAAHQAESVQPPSPEHRRDDRGGVVLTVVLIVLVVLVVGALLSGRL